MKNALFSENEKWLSAMYAVHFRAVALHFVIALRRPEQTHSQVVFLLFNSTAMQYL